MSDDNSSLRLAANIVTAFVSNNRAESTQLPDIIKQVYHTLQNVDTHPDKIADANEPAVPSKKSVFPDRLICLDCGASFKMLKRHLMTDHKLTPQQYRTKWSLAPSYPIVAPDYAQIRSTLAKQLGLGRGIGRRLLESPQQGAQPTAQKAPEQESEEDVVPRPGDKFTAARKPPETTATINKSKWLKKPTARR